MGLKAYHICPLHQSLTIPGIWEVAVVCVHGAQGIPSATPGFLIPLSHQTRRRGIGPVVDGKMRDIPNVIFATESRGPSSG